MTLLRWPWDVPHHPARTWLAFRGVYALLAFDAWVLMIEHGGRYGVGGFNVAHFAFVQRIIPLPSAGLYLGLVTAAGLYALCGAFGLLARAEAVLLWALYTGAWMLSMHDSYQHHYLLSWLLAFGAVAQPLAIDTCVQPGARVREPGLPLVSLCCAIVYTFTAVSKTSPLWRDGVVLQRLAAHGGPMAWVAQLSLRLGSSEADAWQLAALSVVVVQVVIAAGFLASLVRDARPGRTLGVVCGLSFSCAASFHLATELSPSFSIGWFSYYMLWIGGVVLLPTTWLTPLFAPLLALRARFRMPRPAPRWWVLAGALLSCAAGAAFAAREELPGIGAAVVAFSLLLAARAAEAYGKGQRERALGYALTPLWGVALLSAALALAQVRFDYFRRAAGEHVRMGRLREALALYQRAERHAPRGQSRHEKILELERRLASESRDAGVERMPD